MKKAMFFYLTLLFSVFFLSACADEISIYVETPTAPQRNESLSVFYIGALFIPDTDTLPVPDVTVNTRRGVYVTYEPAQNEQ